MSSISDHLKDAIDGLLKGEQLGSVRLEGESTFDANTPTLKVNVREGLYSFAREVDLTISISFTVKEKAISIRDKMNALVERLTEENEKIKLVRNIEVSMDSTNETQQEGYMVTATLQCVFHL